jgi:Pyruvate/2-oxoacid:ferredoxin oxidoreductase gamma subunit
MVPAETVYIDGHRGERRGVPITATTRFSKTPLRSVAPEANADVALVAAEDCIQGLTLPAVLKPGGLLIVNSGHRPEAFCDDRAIAVATADVTTIVRKTG